MEKLYSNAFGLVIARLLARPLVSKAAGAFLSCGVSRLLIKPFVKKNGISLEQAETTAFKSFNDFFTRRLKPGSRPVGDVRLVSPSDGLLSVYTITPESRFNVKGHTYTPEELVGSQRLADAFAGGCCLIFRLTPAHYHRYMFPLDGEVLDSGRINGIFHTVRPFALKKVPVFKTNTREWALYDTALGKVLQMEVGAALVGKIHNYPVSKFIKGQEKGYFEFGGSTIIVLAKGLRLRDDLKAALDTDAEIEITQGENIET